jgi:SAM-dependent methyltransferase
MATKWQQEIPKVFDLQGIGNAISVDLGCGSLPRNPLGAESVIGVDILTQSPYEVLPHSLGYVQVLPGTQLPFEPNQIDCVSAFDFLEHVPRVERSPGGEFRNPFIETMNEVYRILKPGGLFIALTPCYPSPTAFADPTHVNYITEETHLYFSGLNFAKTKGYGFNGEFDLIEGAWSDWKGYLWDTFAINGSEKIKVSSKRKTQMKLKFLIQFKLKLKKKFLGHSGETHFLWVLRKPREPT